MSYAPSKFRDYLSVDFMKHRKHNKLLYQSSPHEYLYVNSDTDDDLDENVILAVRE